MINKPLDQNYSDQTITHVLLQFVQPIKPHILHQYLALAQPNLSLQANGQTAFHLVVQDKKLIPQLVIMLEYIGENKDVL